MQRLAIASMLALWTMAIPSMGQATLAQTQFEITFETPSFERKVLTAGDVKVVTSYRREDVPEERNLTYDLYYQGDLQRQDSDYTFRLGGMMLQDLDGDQVAEVVVNTYSGGAHCCTNFSIYSWQEPQFVKTETGFLDGLGGQLKDLDGDDRFEFLTSNNAFLYRFSSYAGSFPPSQIYTFNQGKFTETTRQYPQRLRSRAWSMYEAIRHNQLQGNGAINGILAGYVAQKALLDEFEQGWEFMLVHYDRESEWGFEIYEGDRQVGKHPDFPTALRAFLVEQGYIGDVQSVLSYGWDHKLDIDAEIERIDQWAQDASSTVSCAISPSTLYPSSP